VNRTAYYEAMKRAARDLRDRYGFTSPRITRSDLRRIYRDEGIRIDLWPFKLRHLRGAYFADDGGGPSVMIAKALPEEPKVFTMAHELKHHFADRQSGRSFCDASNEHSYIEIGAEVFAAELIFPVEDFVKTAATFGVTQGCVDPTNIVRLKHESRTTLSYTAIIKRIGILGMADPAPLSRTKWKKLEEQIYGEPLYKRLRFRRQR
jgi:Zn-dependent peptidase ImmA (M78 family)